MPQPLKFELINMKKNQRTINNLTMKYSRTGNKTHPRGFTARAFEEHLHRPRHRSEARIPGTHPDTELRNAWMTTTTPMHTHTTMSRGKTNPCVCGGRKSAGKACDCWSGNAVLESDWWSKSTLFDGKSPSGVVALAVRFVLVCTMRKIAHAFPRMGSSGRVLGKACCTTFFLSLCELNGIRLMMKWCKLYEYVFSIIFYKLYIVDENFQWTYNIIFQFFSSKYHIFHTFIFTEKFGKRKREKSISWKYDRSITIK